MAGIATCPFCNVINRFYINERRCPHYRSTKVEEKDTLGVPPFYKNLIPYDYYAVFREEQEEIKVLIEEESNERD